MKALILDGSKGGDKTLQFAKDTIETQLIENGWDVDSLILRDMKIASCLGCFGCWIRTPGTCVINDEGRVIPDKFVNSDFVVMITPVTFGGYSSELKKALDRAIPIIQPFFRQVQGETHHVMRYEKYPNLLIIGSLPEKDEESEKTISELVNRNSINYDCQKHDTGIIYQSQSEDEIEETIKNHISKMGVIV